jgi:hypothetical protein
MDFAEGYIGRITTMASFAMVYSGAPLFMWVWAVKTAVFINNIMASYYSIQKVWATPYELIHGELFPDASIVVPFGCGVLVLLPKADRAKFKSRCALMIFIHYAVDHPLYTYAVYSPMTKRVLMRQDCIFLPQLFPMRIARAATGMSPDGEPLVPFRSPIGIREGTDPHLSFGGWDATDPLPEYEDHVRGSRLTRPQDQELMDETSETSLFQGRADDHGRPGYRPCHPSFGEESGVVVTKPPRMGNTPSMATGVDDGELSPVLGDALDSVSTLTTTTPGSGQPLPLTTGASPGQSTPTLPLTFAEAFRTSTGPIDFRFLPRPPEDSRIFHSGGPRGSSFTIRLTFTGVARENQKYRVYQTMPVRVLDYRIALQLLRIDPRGIRIFVEDRILFHRGTISDHFDPDHPALPTPYLIPNAIAEIRLIPIGNFGPAQLTPPLPSLAEQDGEDFPQLIEIDPPSPTIDTDDCTSDEDLLRSDGEGIASLEPIVEESGRFTTSSSLPHRRTSSRVRNQRSDLSQDQKIQDHPSLPRRMVRDRWFYVPEVKQEPNSSLSETQGSSSSEVLPTPDESLNYDQINQLVKRFNVEGRNRRAVLKARLQRAWYIRTHPSAVDVVRQNTTPRNFSFVAVRDESCPDGTPDTSTQSIIMTPHEAITGLPPPAEIADTLSDVNQALDSFLAYKLNAGGIRGVDVFWDEFLALQLQEFDNTLNDNKRMFLDNIYSRSIEEVESLTPVPDALRQQRTIALWAGLRRVYFAEPDVEDWMGDALPLEDPQHPFPRRKRVPRVPDDLHFPVPDPEPPDDSDDAPTGPTSTCTTQASEDQFEVTVETGPSNGEDEDVNDGEQDRGRENGENDPANKMMSRWPTNPVNRLGNKHSNGEQMNGEHKSESGEDDGFSYWNPKHDKYEAAVAVMMKDSEREPENWKQKNLLCLSGDHKQFDTTKAFLNKSRKNFGRIYEPQNEGRVFTDSGPITNSMGNLIGDPRSTVRKCVGNEPIKPRGGKVAQFVSKMRLLSIRTMRRILAAKETIHKYGVFVPRNDREADTSPEAVRWASGRQLEWLRLQEQGTFERNWDWVRLRKAYPSYQKRDVGHVFFVYDHKHSGEHRVRLVFDGSKQNPETYTETYAPTARGESVRLFHVFSVEQAWEIAQFDVPQAFLKSEIDCVLFVYPPNNFAEFPGQLLKLRLSLYGAKQSAALWNKLIDGFLKELGFVSSPMDPCLYKRSDSLIILFCDDLRVSGLPSTVSGIKTALFEKFQITTSDGTRFLGMDTIYDTKKGYLKLHMATYIQSTWDRFDS